MGNENPLIRARLGTGVVSLALLVCCTPAMIQIHSKSVQLQQSIKTDEVQT